MATDLGKLLRRIRLDKDEYLKDMASNLDITSSYLSAIENGKRDMPRKLIGKIGDIYGLSSDTLEKLEEYAGKLKKKVEISTCDASKNKQYTAWAFARQFDDLSDEQIHKIRQILEGND